MDLEKNIKLALESKGYTLVHNPENAHYILQANVLQVGRSDLRAAEHALNGGFGAALSGNNVSHSNRKTKRRFLPNLHWHRFWHPSQNRWIRLLVSHKGMRTIDKRGIEAVLADILARGENVETA